MEVRGRGYVLHKRPYQNSSAIVSLFTETAGCVDVVAKGAAPKSTKSRFNLSPFQRLDIQARGKSGLLSLYASEASSMPFVYEGKQLFCALYINELLKELLPKHDAVTGVFDLYQKSLVALSACQDVLDMEITLRRFELSLLDELGYGIDFTDSSTADDLSAEAYYRFHYDQGFERIAQKIDGSFTGKALNSLSAFDFSEAETRKQAKQLLRRVIAHHLGGKPLKSRELFV